MSYTEFSDLLGSITQEGETHTVTLASDWLQGRTAYGGLTAALCYEVATRSVDDLPPLRSAQFAFTGPAVGKLSMTTSLLRRGKSAGYYGVDLEGEAGHAARAMLCFGKARDSAIDHAHFPAPSVPDPDDCGPLWPPRPAEEAAKAPVSFISHFDQKRAGGSVPRSDSKDPHLLLWLRHRDNIKDTPISGLISLADALPAASIVLFPDFAPFSTMTWAIDFLTDDPISASGWYLVESRADATAQGYSSQTMTIWNDQRQPVLAMRQTVAIFI